MHKQDRDFESRVLRHSSHATSLQRGRIVVFGCSSLQSRELNGDLVVRRQELRGVGCLEMCRDVVVGAVE